jgi:hypothetical protein
LGNWQINGIGRYASGHPFSVTSGVDTNLDGLNIDRADLAGNPRLDTGRSRSQLIVQYFNPAALRTPPTGLDGNSGRNILYGPGSASWDLSFGRLFPFHESHRLQFRSEFFNIFFNKPNFSNPNTVLSSPHVAQILGAGAGRVAQLRVRARRSAPLSKADGLGLNHALLPAAGCRREPRGRNAMVVRRAAAASGARRCQRRLGAQSDRPVYSGAARAGASGAVS